MAHVRYRAWIGAVLGERGICDLRQRPECVGEQQPVKAVIGFSGEFQQLLAGVPAAHDGGVHIQEVTRQSAAEQRADLVGDGVVSMQDGPDGKLNGIVGAPVDGQLDLLLGTVRRVGQGQPGELSALMITDPVPGGLERGDDGGCQLRKLATVLPAGEQVDIAARPVTHPVG